MASSSKLHLDCKACADYQSFVQRIESNGLYVSDLPPQVTEGDLHNLFSTYGKIADLFLSDNGTFCLVHFFDRRSVDEVLYYPVSLYGRELRVRPRFPSKADEDKRAALNDVHISHEEILKALSSGIDFMSQVNNFLKAAEADEMDLRRHYIVCNDIGKALKYISPVYKVIPFGSSVNGLAFKHSDLDLFYGKEVQSNAPDIRDVFRKARLALEKLQIIESFKSIPNARSLNEPILPPLYKLQHDGVKAIWVEGWNAGFDDDPTRLQPVSNNLALEELVCQFFDSMVKTDFNAYAVSPYLGHLIPKHEFLELGRLHGRLSLYVNNVNAGMPHIKTESALCLQDPIELNYNITKNIAGHDFFCFKDHCHVATKLNYSLPPHLFLPQFLSTTYECPRVSEQKSWLPNPMHTRPLRPFMTLYVPYPETVTDNILWTCDMGKTMSRIFRKVLKISVDDEKKGVDTKPGGDQALLCKGSQVLWVRRDELWKKWFFNRTGAPASKSFTFVDDEVKVLDTSESKASTSSGSRGEKRKRYGEHSSINKRKKVDKLQEEHDENKDSEVTVIELEESTTAGSSTRSIGDEINLTNAMVKKGHALPASAFILDFTCKICRDTDNVRIEISDRKSKIKYFSSLCAFLESFLNKHLSEDS